VPDVRLDRLLREEETLADLPIDESVRDELKNLDLARSRVLSDFARGRRGEWDDRAVATRATSRRSRFESTAVVAVAVEDLLALGSVHASAIGGLEEAL
jgi:hypothetical protein